MNMSIFAHFYKSVNTMNAFTHTKKVFIQKLRGIYEMEAKHIHI